MIQNRLLTKPNFARYNIATFVYMNKPNFARYNVTTTCLYCNIVTATDR